MSSRITDRIGNKFQSAQVIKAPVADHDVANKKYVDAHNSGTRIAEIVVLNKSMDLFVGDALATFIVPAEFDNYVLINAAAFVNTPSTSGLPEIEIYSETNAHSMLTTNITIDEDANNSYSATTPMVIDTDYDDVAVGNDIEVNVIDEGTGTTGLIVILTFAPP
jgi:hypothetical protein